MKSLSNTQMISTGIFLKFYINVLWYTDWSIIYLFALFMAYALLRVKVAGLLFSKFRSAGGYRESGVNKELVTT